jgi:uncharacterized protein (TIGR02646 family)
MKKQRRTAAPRCLRERGAKWNERFAEKRECESSARFDWPQFENKSVREWVLPELRNMAQGHCSFCDGFPLEPTSKEPIEHFRPKSEFPKLAFSWDNLFYCCENCQSSKGELWNDLLLKPDAEDFEFDRYFDFDTTNGAIRPNRFSSEADQERARVTIEMYSLDTEVRRKHRKQALRIWLKLLATDTVELIEDHPYRDFLVFREPEGNK